MLLKMDASSLIYAAKAGIMNLIFRLFDEVVIPSVVAHEATRKREKPDAQYILRLIDSGKLKVVDVEPIDSGTLGLGERTTISLALEEDPRDYLLVLDDRRARVLASALGVDSVPLYALLFVAIRRRVLDLINAKKILFTLEKVAGYPKDRLIEISKTLELIYGDEE